MTKCLRVRPSKLPSCTEVQSFDGMTKCLLTDGARKTHEIDGKFDYGRGSDACMRSTGTCEPW